MNQSDTIAAISTPPGRGGIGVVRLSGPHALEIASAIFRARGGATVDRPNRAQFGSLIDTASGELLDEVIVTYFKAPHSYTGEDVIEISCHGSPVILSRVLELVTAQGARIAEPGEFTFRAFLNKTHRPGSGAGRQRHHQRADALPGPRGDSPARGRAFEPARSRA